VHLFRWYQHLHDSLPAIRDDARRAAQALGLRPSRGDIGLYAGSSARPGDAAATNTCESAMRVTLETLCAPPLLRRGDAYRARLLAPYSERIAPSQ